MQLASDEGLKSSTFFDTGPAPVSAVRVTLEGCILRNEVTQDPADGSDIRGWHQTIDLFQAGIAPAPDNRLFAYNPPQTSLFGGTWPPPADQGDTPPSGSIWDSGVGQIRLRSDLPITMQFFLRPPEAVDRASDQETHTESNEFLGLILVNQPDETKTRELATALDAYISTYCRPTS